MVMVIQRVFKFEFLKPLLLKITVLSTLYLTILIIIQTTVLIRFGLWCLRSPSTIFQLHVLYIMVVSFIGGENH
jgi:hypothetical protein